MSLLTEGAVATVKRVASATRRKRQWQTGDMPKELRDDLLSICRAIDARDVAPRAGAARMWSLMAEADYPADTDEFRVFVGMVSEIQDHPEHEAAYEADIRAAARAAITRDTSG